MILFNCWAGLSLSELIAIAAEDVDRDKGIIHVRRARVMGKYKVPKERARIRTVELIDPAIDLLRQIVKDAESASTDEIKVTQRDNVSIRTEKLHFLFRNSTSGLPWGSKSMSTWCTAHLKKSGVRQRGANQCRHIFASQALSSFVPVEWVARQLGHSDTTMVKKHYGRWIPNDTKSMAALVSEMMGFRTAQSGQ